VVILQVGQKNGFSVRSLSLRIFLVGKERLLVVLVGSLLFVGPMARSSNVRCDDAFHVEQVLEGPIRVSGLDFSRPANGWGVGFQYENEEASREFPFVVRYDGRSWTVAPHPPKPARGTVRLNAVSVIAADQVWVSGFRRIGLRDHTYVQFWDGDTWARAATPDPGVGGSVQDVVAISPTDVWAVEHFERRDGEVETMALHFDGDKWTRVNTPSPRSNTALMDVHAASATDVWAVGSRNYPSRGLVLHFDGTGWRQVPLPDYFRVRRESVFAAVHALAADDVWIVGFRDRNRGTGAVSIRWNGVSWRIIRILDVKGHENLLDLDAAGPNQVWTVGDRFVPATPFPLAARWDGSSWRRVPTENPNTLGELEAVSVDGGGSVWAVGSRGADDVMERAC
jgi:hypothetical protein